MAEGYKDWSAGDILTAADLEDYTVKQSVMRFADASARTTALSGVLAEGMMSYLKDTNSVEVYDGSAWLGVGRILQVVQDELTTEFSTSSTSDVAVTGLSVSITPTSATSKILVVASCAVAKNDTNYLLLTAYRGDVATGTNLAGSGNYFGRVRSGTADPYQMPTFHYLDSPATTSATTYIVACKVSAGTGVVSTQNHKSTLTVVEVSA
jgi:hypothetical protein